MKDNFKISIGYNNISSNHHLKSDWGFSCYFELPGKNILFDTGADGKKLLYNLNKMFLKLSDIDVVILSHYHWDHTGGFDEVLKNVKNIKVFYPAGFTPEKKETVKYRKEDKFKKIGDKIYITGMMGSSIKEQAMIVNTDRSLVVVTGCAHPGIENIIEKVYAKLKKDIYLVLGGFHLKSKSKSEINKIIEILKENHVKNVAPSHCTGENAIQLFEKAWGKDNFKQLYLGDKITF